MAARCKQLHVCIDSDPVCLMYGCCCHHQVGTGDRSEKIKTYNYKDSRCSDHRIKQNFDLNKVSLPC